LDALVPLWCQHATCGGRRADGFFRSCGDDQWAGITPELSRLIPSGHETDNDRLLFSEGLRDRHSDRGLAAVAAVRTIDALEGLDVEPARGRFDVGRRQGLCGARAAS
jgi:hypothetical protein